MRLILFFNGWGMDSSVVEKVELPKDTEIKVINFPYKLDNLEEYFTKYEDVFLVGWSFGSYYLTKWVLVNRGIKNFSKVKKIVAINGNGEIIGKFGITPKIFEFTLFTLTPESLIKFYKNMEISEEFQNPKKEFKEILEELEYFKNGYTALENIFTEIIIGIRDKIVPASRQKKYCEESGIKYRELDMGHYPFEFIKAWSEVI